MGAGTSTEQVADKTKEELVEDQNDQRQDQEQPEGQEAEVVDAAGDAKLLQKNGKIAILNGTGEEIEKEETEESVPAKDINGHQDEADVKTVGQQEPPNVLLNEGPENTAVSPEDAASKDGMKQDGVEEIPETNSTTPESEDKIESPEETSENQANEVGFKKVFKFVGFKFTVKKEKTEKSDPVQLLTVKKDEVETNGTENLEKQSSTPEESTPEETQETKDASPESETVAVSAQAVESPQETTEDKLKGEEDTKVEKEQKKSPVSPTNPLTTDTSSPFKRFFTQGWAGLRKKTSFRKSKEEDPQEVEKHINGELQAKIEGQDVSNLTEESQTEAVIFQAQPAQLDDDQPEKEEVKTIIDEETPTPAIEQPKQEESLAIKLDEPKATEKEQTECPAHVAESVLPEAEITENIVDVVVENVVTVTKELTEIIPESDIAEKAIIALSEVSSTTSPPNAEEIQVLKPDTELNDRSVDSLTVEQSQVDPNPECAELEKSQDAITTEAELLSSQEKAKLQGSPLRKLFSSSGLRKLSAKKHKSKKDDDAKVEDVSPQAPASSESPEVPDADGGESSPSSPEESGETSPTDKIPEDSQQTAEVEGEGVTSDGERKRDGITPWASFKKLVTPKKRPKRPSESDKEDEVEKVKSSTMSSTDSAGYVENQEEVKENGEEQKLEKSTEENKKKVDNSVSWEALICVGSSKRRARKTSDSEEELPNTLEESKITEEDISNAKELDSDGPPVSSQEKEQDSSSPDQANSPTEGDGVSTWQSFKRLVTPRRKSKSKAEDKIEEPTVTSSVEQSTLEGEAGKDETWVSLKKLIPGRKKKRSDAKLDQGTLNEGRQAIPSETVEDDSDEPAVVPLAEFDAAEQEKLEAQQSGDTCALNDVSTELVTAPENSEELVHAVTVTVIEGERAVTSLEERSPSWISATVAETLEKDNLPVEEEPKEIKSEVKVEEHVIFTSVSQVVTESKDPIISDVEMTAEAITALEEAIENSYAEETTEMISAVSQLGESLVTTEDATPVPEEDESAKSLEERKKQTDQILQEVAEKAQLSAIALTKSSTVLLERSSVSANVVDFGKIQAQDTHKEGKTVDEEKSIVKDNVEEFQIGQTSVCITTFTERSTILPVVASPSLLEVQTIDDFSTVDQNVKEIVFLSHQKRGDISISSETNASEDIIVWRGEQTREETFAEKHTVEGLHNFADKDAGVVLVLVTDEEQTGGGSPCLAEKEEDFVLISAEEPNTEITGSTAEKQANEPLSISVVEQEKEDMPSWSTEQIQKRAFTEEQTSNLVNIASLDNSDDGAFISQVEKTGSDLPMLSIEKTKELIKTKIYTLEKTESAQLSSEKDDEKHTSSVIQVKEAVYVSGKMAASSLVIFSAEEQSKGFASTVAKQQTDESPTVVSEKSADEVKPILDKADNSINGKKKECEDGQELALGDEGTPVVSEKENDENILVLTGKPAEEVYQISTEKEAVKDHVLSEENVEVAADLTVASVDGSSGTFEKEVSDIGERPADGLHVLTVEQAENIIILSQEKEVVDIAVSQVQESSPSFTEKTFDGTSEGEDKIAEEIKPILIEEQTENLHVLSTEKADACDLALEHAGACWGLADKPFDEEEQVENALVISAEKVDLTLDKADGGATIVTEKQTIDVISALAENIPEDVCHFLTEGQAEKSPILVEEKVEFPVLIDEADDCISVSAAKQLEEDSNILAVDQMGVLPDAAQEPPVGGVFNLAEVKADVSPVLTKKLDSEDALLAVSVPPFSVEGLTHESDLVLAEEQTADISPGFTDKEQEPVFVKEQVEPVTVEEQAKDVKEKAESEFTEGQIKANILLPSLDIKKTAESESIVIDNLGLKKQSVIALHTEEGTIDLQKLETEGSTTGPTDKESLTSEETKCVLTEEPIVLIAEKDVASVLIHQKESPIISEVDADENVLKSQKSMESDAVIKKEQSVCVETEQIVSDSKPVPSWEQHLESIPVSIQKEETEEIPPVLLEGQPEKSIHILQEQETSLCKTSESTIVTDVISNVTESAEPIVTDISQDEETDVTKTLTHIDKSANARETEMELNYIGVEEQLGDLKSSAAVCQGRSTLSTVVEEELKMIEEIATTEIPELESAEANKASEPVVAAAVEEQILAESLKPIATPSETTSLNQTAENVNIISSKEYEITPGTLQTAALVSQKAAAIVDAAIEAAAGCLILDNISHVTLEEKSATQNGFSVSWDDQQSIHTERSVEEKGTVETITLESHSTTIVHKIIETSVEKVVNSGQDFLICNTVESKSLEEKSSPGDQQAVVFSSSSSKEISVETKQDYQPPSSELGVTSSSTIVGQVEKEIVCEVLKVVTTTTCIEHQGKAGVVDPQKAFVELETKDNMKEDLIQEQDVSALLENETGKELSTGDHETVRLSSFPDQTSSETVQIIQPEIKSSVPAYMLEEEISTQDDCIDVRTQDVSQYVES